MSNNLTDLLKRTNLKVPFDTFLENVQNSFPSIGKIKNYLPINEGYEDANIIFISSIGKFVLKIFLAERNIENIKSYVRILTQCADVGVPTLELINNSNNGLGFVEFNGVKTYYIITKFFEGSNFQKITPTLDDIQIISSFISKLNTLEFDVVGEYDSWGIKNFLSEYDAKHTKLTPKQDLLISEINKEFESIDISKFSKSVIHGDMQRKHVIKNKNGEYCILDFGCMAFDYKVIDLATYLAWFCLQEDTWKERESIYKNVLTIYNNTQHLTNKEIETIPTLIRTSYAAYYLTTCVMINEGDKSEETADWNHKSERMLELTNNWTIKRLS